MSDHDWTEDSPERHETEPTPFERFQSLTKRLLHVPKQEVDEAVACAAEKRRTA